MLLTGAGIKSIEAACRLARQAMEEGYRPSPHILFWITREHPELRRSRTICILGLVYYLTIVSAWIIYAASRGI